MKVLAIIVLILIFPLFFLSIFGLSLKFTVQNKNFIKKELKSQKVYAKINKNFSEIVGLFPENRGEEGTPVLSNAELGKLLQEALTPQILEENAELLLDGRQANDSQQKRFSDSILKIVEAKYNTLPVCPAGQEPKEMSCRPEGVTLEELQKQLPTDGTLHITSENGDFKITQTKDSETAPDTSQSQTSGNLSGLFSLLGKLAVLTYILPVILVFIIFFLARGYAGSWLGGAKVFGIFLATLSFISLGINILLSLLNKPIVNMISKAVGQFPNLQKELIIPLLNDVFYKINIMTDIIAGSVAVFGIVIAVIFTIIQKTNQKESVPTIQPVSK